MPAEGKQHQWEYMPCIGTMQKAEYRGGGDNNESQNKGKYKGTFHMGYWTLSTDDGYDFYRNYPTNRVSNYGDMSSVGGTLAENLN